MSANPPDDFGLTAKQHAAIVDDEAQKLVKSLVAKIARSAPLDVHDDLVQIGNLGLMEAKRTYDAEGLDTRFLSYATTFIAFAIYRGLRGEKREQVGRAMLRARGGVRFLAEETDRYRVVHDTKELNQQRLQTLSDQFMAAELASLGMPPPNPEQALRGAKDRRIARRVLRAVQADANDEQREIMKVRYKDAGTLTSIAQERTGPIIRVRRAHKKILDDIRTTLVEHEIDELPALGHGFLEDDDEETWP
jgi:RNA polymerase sigma factor (sigma-70 family)